jgi:excisionase family DNA binding protein
MPRIFDVIEAPNQGPNDMVARVPEIGSGDFRLGSQVIVRESQTAVFFRDGKALDTFGPGRHTITTANIPLLTGLVGLAFSGQTPFKAEVYFVNMREFREDRRWGTPSPIPVRDPDLGMARLMANGSYVMQIAEPQMFVAKVVGTQGLYQTMDIDSFLRTVLISALTESISEMKLGVFDLPAQFSELRGVVLANAQRTFTAAGILLKDFIINSIVPTEETQAAIDKRAAMGAVGAKSFLEYQSGVAVEKAASQPGGEGGAGAGLGLGAGIGMGAGLAGMVTQAMQQAQQPHTAAPAAVPDVMTTIEAAAYLKVSEADVLSMIQSGQLKARQIGSQYRISKAAIDEFLRG